MECLWHAKLKQKVKLKLNIPESLRVRADDFRARPL